MDGVSLAKNVLEALIDKYESSESFRIGEPSKQRIQVRLTDKLVSGYSTGLLDPDVRNDLHAALALLVERGFMELKWVKFEEGNILDRVYLVWDAIDDIYVYLCRISRRDKLADITAEMEKWRESLLHVGFGDDWQWVSKWVEEVITSVQLRGRIPTSLVPEDNEARKLLLRALAGLILKNDSTIPIRLFSKRYLGNSKVFERQIQSNVVRLVRRYWMVGHPLDLEAPEDDSTLLREFGIESGHEDITFCGPVRFRYEGEEREIDAGVFPHGLAIDAGDVRRIQITRLLVSRVLTIENKANYRTYVRHECRPDEMVVYLGGFASPAQREFLRLLRMFLGMTSKNETGLPTGAQEVTLHHWGDLDYGGILILQNVRNTCWPEVTAWRMEPELLNRYADYVEPVDEAYRVKLERLLESDIYAWAHPLVRRILDVGGTLEQEALLV